MDGSAVAEAYRLYATAIWRRCYTLLRNDATALDVSQEVFVRCLRHHQKLRPGRELLGWLYRVATNLCLNHLRDAKTRRIDDAAPVPEEVPTEADATARLTVTRILDGLDPRSQELAVYVIVDGMTHAEAAQVAGVSERTVRNCLGRFVQHGRAVLDVAPQKEL
jgi:RNA polymerase sigma-70 factor (ECF subfamily)